MLSTSTSALALVVVVGLRLLAAPPVAVDEDAFLLAFGSCLHERLPAPFYRRLPAVLDAFVWLGDNVYVAGSHETTLPGDDAAVAAAFAAAYARRAAHAAVVGVGVRARAQFATWDDHDAGGDDAGGDGLHHRLLAEAAMRRAFSSDACCAGAAAGDGVYSAHTLANGRLRLVLLDTRSHRTPLPPARPRSVAGDVPGRGPYKPFADGGVEDAAASVLGERQWAWLVDELAVDADVLVVGSSTQVTGAGTHGWEGWSLFPTERRRLLRAIAAASARVRIIISGDLHWATMNVLNASAADGGDDGTIDNEDDKSPRRVLEVTSSSLNYPFPGAEEVVAHERFYTGENFGLIAMREHSLTATVRAADDGRVVMSETIEF